MGDLCCIHCDHEFGPARGRWGFSKAAHAKHVQRCSKATEEERRHWLKTGHWPARKKAKVA